MFGWLFGPSELPISDSEQLWVDETRQAVTARLGSHRIRSAPLVLPTIEFFPSRYTASDDEVRDLLQRVASFMQVHPGSVELEIIEDLLDEDPPKVPHTRSWAETQERFPVLLLRSRLFDPLHTVAEISRRLADIALGPPRSDVEEDTREGWIDLAAIALGMGIVCANDGVRETNWSNGVLGGWEAERPAAISLNMFGYALAAGMINRPDPVPRIHQHLRPDVRAAYRASLKLLQQQQSQSIHGDRNG